MFIASMLGSSSIAAIKNMAVVVSAGSKLSDIPLADLVKLCKGNPESMAGRKSFTLVIKNPESPEMRVAVQKLFGDASGDFKAAIAKLNESRVAVKIAGSDEELLRTVESTPGAVGILDVYSINSSVKVLRVDGKLPFDIGYAQNGLTSPRLITVFLGYRGCAICDRQREASWQVLGSAIECFEGTLQRLLTSFRA